MRFNPKEVEIDPRSVTKFDAEVKEDDTLNFIEKDLRRQVWLFCKKEDVDFNDLEWSEIKGGPMDEDKPKGPYRYFVEATIKHPKTLGRTKVGGGVAYPYEFLVNLGIVEEITD